MPGELNLLRFPKVTLILSQETESGTLQLLRATNGSFVLHLHMLKKKKCYYIRSLETHTLNIVGILLF